MSITLALKKKINKIRFRGKNYKCPICGFEASHFLPAGLYKKRMEAKCPNCGSLERHRQLFLILKNVLAEKNINKILHFAPEKCLEFVLRNIKGVTYYTSHYNEVNVSDYNLDIQDLSLGSASFDLIICSHVLEHVEDDTKAMYELNRVLCDQGIALIQVPIWPSEKHQTYENPAVTDPADRLIHFGQEDHVRIYGLDIVHRLTNAGFNVETKDLSVVLNPEIVHKYALKNHGGVRDLTFICTKSHS